MERQNEVTIIADNGGGITIQVVMQDGYKYQHHYYNPEDAAADLLEAKTANVYTWGGNEKKDWLVPTYEQENNGGYYVISLEDLLEMDSPSLGWLNVHLISKAVKEGR